MTKSKTDRRRPHSGIIKNLLEEIVRLLPEHYAQTDKILGQREKNCSIYSCLLVRLCGKFIGRKLLIILQTFADVSKGFMFIPVNVDDREPLADDFCKEFMLQQKRYMVEDGTYKHRDRSPRMNDAEIMVVLILFHSGGFNGLPK